MCEDNDNFLVSGDLGTCAWCGKEFVGEEAYCGKECSAIAMVEGWSSDGKSPEEQPSSKGENAQPEANDLLNFMRSL